MDAVEAATADYGGDDGAGGFGVGEADVAAAGVAVDGHFWDQGDADAGGDHAEEAAELAALEGDVGSDAGVSAGAEAEIAEAVAVAEHDERFPAQIFESESRSEGARVVFFQGGEERFGADGEEFEIFVVERESKDRDVDGEVAEAFDQDGRGFFEDAEFCIGIFFREGGGVGGHQIRRDRWNDADGDVAAEVGVFFGDTGAREVHLFEDCAGVRNEGAAGFGEADAAAEAIEEFHS